MSTDASPPNYNKVRTGCCPKVLDAPATARDACRMGAPTPGARISDDGNYWWDGNDWQLTETGASASAASAATTPDAESPEDIFSGSEVQNLLGSSGQIAALAAEELSQDPEMAAMRAADPSGFDAVIAEVVYAGLQAAGGGV